MTPQERDNAGDRSLLPLTLFVMAMCLIVGTALGWGLRGREIDKVKASEFNRGVMKGMDEALKGLVNQGVIKEVKP